MPSSTCHDPTDATLTVHSNISKFNQLAKCNASFPPWRFAGPWQAFVVSDDESLARALDDAFVERPATQRGIRSVELSFLNGTPFVESVDEPAVPAAKFQDLWNSAHRRFILLDRTNIPIFEAVEQFGFKKDAVSALNYVRFFFSVVVARSGSFSAVYQERDIRWDKAAKEPDRSNVSAVLQSLSVIEDGSPTFVVASGAIVFKDALLKSKAHVAL